MIVHNSFMHNSQNQKTTQMSFNGRLAKQIVEQQPMEPSSALKRDELLRSTWTNLQGIMLSEKSQSPKANYCMTPFT